MLDLLFGFKGRINRQKWWLVGIGVPIMLSVLFGIVFFAAGVLSPQNSEAGLGFFIVAVATVLLLAVLWIGIAVSIKRYHDLNKSGWWILITFVPVIGYPWYLIENGFFPGTMGSNNYGADPLGKF